jgi:hypothetical protein
MSRNRRNFSRKNAKWWQSSRNHHVIHKKITKKWSKEFRRHRFISLRKQWKLGFREYHKRQVIHSVLSVFVPRTRLFPSKSRSRVCISLVPFFRSAVMISPPGGNLEKGRRWTAVWSIFEPARGGRRRWGRRFVPLRVYIYTHTPMHA